jgi:hypothetical protein
MAYLDLQTRDLGQLYKWETTCTCAPGYFNSNGSWADGCEDIDSDLDGIGDASDNCPDDPNPDQSDRDYLRYDLANGGSNTYVSDHERKHEKAKNKDQKR